MPNHSPGHSGLASKPLTPLESSTPRLKRWGQYARLQLLLMSLGLMSLGWNLVAAVLYPLLPAATGRRIGRAAIAYVYRTFWAMASASGLLHMDTRALDVLRNEPGLIIVANHPSLLDAMLVVARLPRCCCIMKASLMRNIFLGSGARLARYLRNDTSLELVRSAVTDLKKGGQLLMFPEGTRTTATSINPLRPGVAVIAKRAKAPIQAILIEAHSPYLRKGWSLWKLPAVPIEFKVHLGRRFEPPTDASALLTELEAYFMTHAQDTP